MPLNGTLKNGQNFMGKFYVMYISYMCILPFFFGSGWLIHRLVQALEGRSLTPATFPLDFKGHTEQGIFCPSVDLSWE